MEFLGRNESQVFFSSNGSTAIVDEGTNTVSLVDLDSVIASAHFWNPQGTPALPQSEELANAALNSLDISVFSSTDRMHTIPKAVVAEAKRGLEWRKEHGRGGTQVGLNTARTLAKGGQIGIRKIRHIAKYFPRHEVDKKGKGYKPGDDGYPSKGRIAWALWGGDAAQRWASAIVERENKKENSTLIASHGYYEFEKPNQVDFEMFNSEEVKYMARVRMDGSGIDRLYAIKPCGTVLVWDDGCWDDLGNIEHDIDTYDKTLDDPYDSVTKLHIPIDAEAAITLAALFDINPFAVRKVEEVAPRETDLFEKAKPYLNYSDMSAVVAAPAFKTDQDGTYTSEERSEKATSQMRDALGRFAVTGSRVIVGKDPNLSGRIVSQDGGTQKVKVELDDGRTIDIAANQTQQEDTFTPEVAQGRQQPEAGGASLFDSNPLDTSGILGEPRTPVGFGATMPGTLPPLTRDSLHTIINDFPAWVGSQRTAADSAENSPSGRQRLTPEWSPKEKTEPDRWYEDPNKKIKNAMNNPMIRDFLDDPKNRGWYTYDISKPDKVEAQKSRDEVYSTPKARQWSNKALLSAAEDGNEDFKNPRESDVAPMYMAIVAEDDPQAVMNVIALVPKNKTSTTPTVFKRDPGQWVPEPEILQDLQSPTPPPVVMLDTETLEEVVRQIDGPEVAAEKKMAAAEKEEGSQAVAASGINHAENLRKYWLFGPGGQKIRWGMSGDFNRCVEHVSKFMGPRAKSYCALQYKAATGEWAGAITAGIVPTEEEFLEKVALRARKEDARSRVSLTAGGYGSKHNGAKFYIPLVIPEDIESGDGRMFKKGSIKMRDLPLPLLWQIKTGDGHDGSVVVGKIERMERTDDGIGNAYGVFDPGVYGREAERLVRGGFIRGVSADLDQFEADQEDSDADEGSDGKIENGKIKISKARVMAVTLVPKPAFQECQIKIVDDMSTQEEEMIPDGVYVDDVGDEDASSLVACGIVAGVIPTTPPAEWFENPKLKTATPLTVDDDGRVFGHIAAWHVDHIGMSFGTKPPRSRSKYSYFHTGVVRTMDGTDVPVGQLTLAGGHASLEASAQEAVRHYDDTASAIADVHAGEDAYGIWVAGALRPGTTPEQIRSLRASAPSGDWRPIKGHLELVAVCQVNVPGFPIARSRVASGQVMALVAAGANTLARMKSDPYAELKARLERIENKEKEPLLAAAAEAKERFTAMAMAAKAEELSAKVKKMKEEDELTSLAYMLKTYEEDDDNDDEGELAVISRRVRKRLAKEGKAMPDGSFPIRNINDLRNAVRAYGRSKPGSRAAVRRHIVKRARALKRRDLVPQKWKEASIDAIPENGIVAAADDPCWEGYVMVGMKTVDGKEVPNCVPKDAAASEALEAAVTAAAPGECPPATQDIALNLKNRKNAIDTAMYGPLNPAEPNEEYWSTLGDEWGVDVETAKQQRCGNCAVFVISPSMKDCISSGLTDNADEFDAIDSAGELGYCEAFDFKCASARTCRAWVGGGPVTEDKPVTSAGVAYDVNDGPEAVDSPKAQRESEEEGLALPDGSYRIADERDLKRALWAYGRWPNKRSGRARAHIIKRAKALGKEDMLPQIWPGSYNSSKNLVELSVEERVEIVKSMVAAGGLDRNRGNAERLRRYWTKGPGALKIRWGTPGDWTRCVRYLSKYMGPRAKGYCQLRHKEATGVYTGSKLNPGRRKGRNNSIFSAFTEQEFGILEAVYGDISKFTTEVTEFDMMMPIYKIMEIPDKLYDVLWEPDEWVVVLLMDDKNTTVEVELVDDDLAEDIDDYDDFDDFGLDDYDDDGLFAIQEGELAAEEDEEDEDLADQDYSDDPSLDPSEQIDDGEEDNPEAIEERKRIAKNTKFRFEGGKYTAETQPRDASGRFRKVLARLKVDLGAAGANRAIQKIEEAENLDFAGDYARAAEAAGDLIGIIDRLDTGALNPESIENVREGSRELGEVISNLPFAFGEQAEKIRFSDMPPALRDLMEDMITRVEAKIGPEDAAEATKELKSFMSGNDLFSQGDISAQMAKLLRLLT